MMNLQTVFCAKQRKAGISPQSLDKAELSCQNIVYCAIFVHYILLK